MIKDQGLKAFVLLDAWDAQRPLQAFIFYFCYLTFPLKLTPTTRQNHFLMQVMQADFFLPKKYLLTEEPKQLFSCVFFVVVVLALVFLGEGLLVF